MAEQERIVIAERPRLQWRDQGPERVIYHLPDGPPDEGYWFQAVQCGGGIALPGPREKVPRSLVCADCLAGNQTL